MTNTDLAKNRAEVVRAQLESQGDKVSLAKGMLLRQDGDREATWQVLRDTFTRIDAGQKGCS